MYKLYLNNFLYENFTNSIEMHSKKDSKEVS